MSIFTRRDIQKAIVQIKKFLTPNQLTDITIRLNGKAQNSLSAEWEVVVLSSLSQCGIISYEKNFGVNTTKPDVLFSTDNFEFLTDIRTVSDSDKHEKNPYNHFCTLIRDTLRSLDHSSTGLYIDVQHRELGSYGKRKFILALPPREKIQRFVETELYQFLSGIAKKPETDCVLNYDNTGYKFSIRYHANEKMFSGGNHISYTVPYSSSNPLTNALIAKGAQLAKSGYRGGKGIIICDGGCDALDERSPFGGAFGCQEIVKSFLKMHSYILWVLVLRIEQRHSAFTINNKVKIKPTLIWNPDRHTELFYATQAVLKKMVTLLPQPETSATNAVSWLNSQRGKVGRSLRGGYYMSNKTIKISARVLTELLAGKAELHEFLKEHERPMTFFKNQIAMGNTLKNASVEKNDHEDDDWIVLEYDGPDAAISPFRVPPD